VRGKTGRVAAYVLLVALVAVVALAGRMALETSRAAERGAVTVRPGVILQAGGRAVPLGGLSRESMAAAVATSSSEASAAVLVTVRDSVSGQEATLTAAALGWQDNATEVVEAAWSHGRPAAGDFWQAFRERYMDEVPQPLSLSLAATCSPEAIAAFAERVAAESSEAPKDASRHLEGRTPVVVPGSDGYSLEASAVASAILEAAASLDPASGGLEATASYAGEVLPHNALPNDALVVDRVSRTVALWLDGKRVRSYDIAVGTAAYPTPAGDWEVTLLRRNPTWVNPAPNGWGSDMPASIPPGPDNPLGVRAINISAPGIRFHGTTAENTVGTAASHGCMRMRKPDILDLFERVYVGMPVYVR